MSVKELIRTIDGELFKAQREWLLTIANSPDYTIDDKFQAEGLMALCDAVADIAHDEYGIDCLID